MERQIIVKYPEELAFSLKKEDSEFDKEIRKLSLTKFYELDEISLKMPEIVSNTTPTI